MESWVAARKQPFTLNDAAAGTGIALNELEHAFETLISKYNCRVQATAQGDVIYDFGRTLRRRNAKTAAEILLEVLAWLWRGFQLIYKACIALVMVVYFIVFVVILLVAIILAASAASGSKEDKKGSAKGSIDLRVIGDLFMMIFRFAQVTDTVMYVTDAQGYRYRQYQPAAGALNKAKKGFIASVYDFVFGPPRVEIDPLANEKELAAFLRKNKGVLVGAELQALTGWSTDEMENFLAEYVAKFRGQLKVTEDGVLYAEFDELLRGKVAAEESAIVYYWDEYEPEYVWTGNDFGRNLVIVLMNSFNLFFSYFVLTAEQTILGLIAITPTVRLVLGWFPFVYSVLFFLIPLVRGIWIVVKQQERHHANIRRRILKAVFADLARPKTRDELWQLVNQEKNLEKISREVLKEMMEKLVVELRGKLDVDATSGTAHYAFEQIHHELSAIRQIRAARTVSRDLGDVILDSGT
ncbi:MAG: hypothetical protein RMI34_07250 [Chloroherpetonaceae bacterium]|nr:hypothetical protein [Chloroherpetonaceae bacterium]